MRIHITKYGHAIIFAILGIWMGTYSPLWASFIGGVLIGWGLKLAREYGEENGR